MPEKQRPVADDHAFQAEVLAACRRLLAKGRYPSGQILVLELPGHGQAAILFARSQLVASGRLAIDIKPSRPGPAAGRRSVAYSNRGLDQAEADQVADRVRRIYMAVLRKNWRGEPPELYPDELDEVLPAVECRRTRDRQKGAEHHAQ